MASSQDEQKMTVTANLCSFPFALARGYGHQGLRLISWSLFPTGCLCIVVLQCCYVPHPTSKEAVEPWEGEKWCPLGCCATRRGHGDELTSQPATQTMHTSASNIVRQAQLDCTVFKYIYTKNRRSKTHCEGWENAEMGCMGYDCIPYRNTGGGRETPLLFGGQSAEKALKLP